MSLIVLVLLLLGTVTHLAAATPGPSRVAGLRANVPLPTLGGLQWWGDVALWPDWRIQQHAVTGHARVLDRRGMRRAWGSLAACRAFVDARDPQAFTGELVLFLHGLGRTRHQWTGLSADVRAVGFTPVPISWPSTREDVPQAATRLRLLIQQLSAEHAVTSLRFVTHSQGGILLRFAMTEPVPEMPPLRSVVFCFPPHQGARLADLVARWRWPLLLLGPGILRVTHAGARSLPSWQHGSALVIAGGRGDGHGLNPWIPGDDDGIVAVADTTLTGSPTVVLPVNHTFGVRDPGLRHTVLDWLQRETPTEP